MTFKWTFSLSLLAVSLNSCSSYQPNISVACEENDAGTSVVKWETFPEMNGSIKVYASTSPTNIPIDEPIATVSISEQRLSIAANNASMQRMYYMMVFNDEYPVATASRNVIVPGTQNFRDIGGYATGSRNEIGWGKVYRSAQLDSISAHGYQVLKGLGIKTIIDLRDHREYGAKSPRLKGFKFVNAPLYTDHIYDRLKRIHNGETPIDSIQIILQKINLELIDGKNKEIKKVFQTLLDPHNYPIVITCSTGKMRTGFITALLLNLLGVNYEMVVQDYELSNNYFNITRSCNYAFTLSESTQEAITALYTSQGDCLDGAFEKIQRQYGSVENYLCKKVGLSQKDVKQLKNILLTSEDR